MSSLIQTKHVLAGNHSEILHQIHQASAAIWHRPLSENLAEEVAHLLASSFTEIKIAGQVDKLVAHLRQQLPYFPLLCQDIDQLIRDFRAVVHADNIRFSLVAVSSDMCRKFHTDVIDFRLLCSYAGVATLYVAPENAPGGDVEPAAASVEQLAVGDVMIFRGAMSATDDCPPLLHKSPSAQKLGLKRLLLRLDTNDRDWFSLAQ